VELLFVSVAILGFPSPSTSIVLARGIFQERRIAFEAPPPASDDGTQRYRRGLEVLLAVNGEGHLRPLEAVSPDLARCRLNSPRRKPCRARGWKPKAKQLAIISMLAATGNRDEALDFHLKAALKQGLSPVEIAEALMQLSVYAGFSYRTQLLRSRPTGLFGRPWRYTSDHGAICGGAVVREPGAAPGARARDTCTDLRGIRLKRSSAASNDIAPDNRSDDRRALVWRRFLKDQASIPRPAS